MGLPKGFALELRGAVEAHDRAHYDIAHFELLADPPAVPVVSTSLGRTSSMICCQTSMFGSSGPSCDMCESDLNTTTEVPPIAVVQYVPNRFASTAGQPLRIFREIEA